MHRDHWQSFYSGATAERVPLVESLFARWVAERIDDDAPVLDVGTGTARDARFFALKGHPVTAVDNAAAAVEKARELSSREGWTASFHRLDLADLDAVESLVAVLDWTMPWHLYARFLVHALDDRARGNLWVLANRIASAGGECFFEFRTDKDADQPHVFGEHFRLYLSPSTVAEELRASKLEVREMIEGRGLAPHRDEDPWVARLRVGSIAA